MASFVFVGALKQQLCCLAGMFVFIHDDSEIWLILQDVLEAGNIAVVFIWK